MLLSALLQLPPTLEYNISPGPLPNDNGSLVFVVLRLTTYPKNKPCDLPRSVAEKFSEVFSSSAQQFKGYIFETQDSTFEKVCTSWRFSCVHNEQAAKCSFCHDYSRLGCGCIMQSAPRLPATHFSGRCSRIMQHCHMLSLTSCTALWYGHLLQGFWTVAFQDSMDALRFTHAAQMLLMYVPWTGVSKEYCGTALPSPDGRWLYIGPRVCMAIHESADYFVSVGVHRSHVRLWQLFGLVASTRAAQGYTTMCRPVLPASL